MDKYDSSLSGDKQSHVNITKIIVPTEYDKQQLLLAFKYIHYLSDLDTDYKAVNTIVHLYLSPDLVEISKTSN